MSVQTTKSNSDQGQDQDRSKGVFAARLREEAAPAVARGLAPRTNDDASADRLDSASASRARKGDLVLVEIEHSCDYQGGERRKTVSYQLCVVGTATRDGVVKTTLDPSAYIAGRQPCHLPRATRRRWVLGQDRVDVDVAMRSLSAERGNEFGAVEDFGSLEEAQQFVRRQCKP